MAPDWIIGLGGILAVGLMATAALMVPPRRVAAVGPGQASPDPDQAVFLFDQELLVDATPPARLMLNGVPSSMNDLGRLCAALMPRFPDLQQEISKLPEAGTIHLTAPMDRASLTATFQNGLSRIVVTEHAQGDDEQDLDAQSLAAQSHELETLRRVVSHMQTLAWQQDSAGNVIWANSAYLQQAADLQNQDDLLVWPLPRLFDIPPTDEAPSPRRLSLTGPDGAALWFDCSALPGSKSPMFFAAPADAVVNAEASLQNFVQTLTKTFAGLPTGLAIFNRARNLVMFNPALVDLTMLEPLFLARRPSLFEFLDKLREKRMIPEPRDYKSWRREITELEEGAASGEYEATWTLPSGLTYRVTGRPHPDGAVAFLFQDITAEISLTRRFRAELEMGQAVLDSLDEAIAIFSPAGILTMSNRAYSDLWDQDPSTSLAEIGIHDATRAWQDRCAPNNIWAEARDFVARVGPRTPRETLVVMEDGKKLCCRIRAIAGGAALIGFRELHQHETDAPALT